MAKVRPGYKDFFPVATYVDVIRALSKLGGVARYGELSKITGHGIGRGKFGIKIARMKEQGLISKKDFGLYEITPYGRKVLSAVDAYRKVMKEHKS